MALYDLDELSEIFALTRLLMLQMDDGQTCLKALCCQILLSYETVHAQATVVYFSKSVRGGSLWIGRWSQVLGSFSELILLSQIWARTVRAFFRLCFWDRFPTPEPGSVSKRAPRLLPEWS